MRLSRSLRLRRRVRRGMADTAVDRVDTDKEGRADTDKEDMADTESKDRRAMDSSSRDRGTRLTPRDHGCVVPSSSTRWRR